MTLEQQNETANRADTNTLGASAAADPDKLHVTFFPDDTGSTFTTESIHIWDLRDRICNTAAATKEQLPWLKLATFGDVRSAKNSLRHNANVIAINGVEGDYDGEQIDLATAIARLKAARIRFLGYTSPSHTPAAPRWRVLAPTSHALAPAERSKLVARLNGVLGGILANESFTLSQSFYYGKLNGNGQHRCDYYLGDFIDERPDLDSGAAYKQTRSRVANGPLTDVPGVEPDLPITRLDDARLGLPPNVRHMIMTATPPKDAPHFKGGRGHCRVIGHLVRRGLSNAQIKQVYLLGSIKNGPIGHPRGFDGYVERVIRLMRSASQLATRFEAQQPINSRLKLIAFDDIQLTAEPEYLIEGLIPHTGMTVVWGRYKSGKSFWVFDAVMHIALGWEYRGRQVQQGAAIYCALEGQTGFAKRKIAFEQRHLAEDHQPVPFYLQPTTLDLVRDHAELIAMIRATLGEVAPAVLVLDTLNRSLAGSESSDKDMAAYIQAADAIREAFGCVVIIVHHCGIDGTRPRGHTSLTGAAEAQLSVERDTSGNIITTVEWMKDGGTEGTKIISALEVVEVGEDLKGKPITSCVVVPSDDVVASVPGGEPQKLTGNVKVAYEALCEAIYELGEVIASTKIPPQTRTVELSAGHRYFAEKTVDTGIKPDSVRTNFSRAVKTLQDRGIIGVFKGRVWITGHAGHARTS
jgi:hypothetical protein